MFKKSIKLITIVILSLFVFTCAVHYNLAGPEIAPPRKEMKKNTKIGFVGFLSYRSVHDGDNGRYPVVLDSSARLRFHEDVGMSTSDMKFNGFRKDISKAKIENLVNWYMGGFTQDDTKESAKKELENIIQFPTSESQEMKLKDFSLDYYVVGKLEPGFEFSKNLGWAFISGFNYIVTTLTLGIIPSWFEIENNLKIAIYNKNLDKISELNIDASYSTYHAVWATPYPKECAVYGRMHCWFKRGLNATPTFAYKNIKPVIENEILEVINK
ncbi:hypothetical protein L9Z41_07680 [Leptospira noguchii]|uniref:Lp29 family lipoprotein n=1 Tax=Leptospira noguchii TaxID=28182 RepID=UPI001F05DA82|nr:hypothetical protein [Leptospira noguchii]MCH1913219.1 hypothetical protein [Leptospira noguchii]MCH1915522.1 hypothetical protein [Leptospira noguchii]UOG65358.1 hypothetical protein MAL04_08025 [Leptospira noguchii]